MNYMWLLTAIAFVAIVSTAREIIKGGKRRLPECVVPLYSSRLDSTGAMRSFATCKLHAEWISMKGCEELLRNTDNVVFFAIRSGSRNEPLPFPGINALSISPNQLVDVLRWLPAGNHVILCGEVDLCFSIVGPPQHAAGSASIYVLKAGHVLSKAG